MAVHEATEAYAIQRADRKAIRDKAIWNSFATTRGPCPRRRLLQQHAKRDAAKLSESRRLWPSRASASRPRCAETEAIRANAGD